MMSTQARLRIVPTSGLCAACKVRDVSACAVLDDSDLKQAEAIAAHKTFEPGRTLFDETDDAPFIYNVTEGTVRLVKLLPSGRRQIVGFAFPGDMLGLAAHGEYTCSAEAITAVSVCRFPRKPLLELLEALPRLKTRLLDIAAEQLSGAQDQMLLLGRKSPVEKLSSFLLRLAGGQRHCGTIQSEVDLAMTRSDIADYLGLTIETVSRTFTKLKTVGLITLSGKHRVTINDVPALEELAEDAVS